MEYGLPVNPCNTSTPIEFPDEENGSQPGIMSLVIGSKPIGHLAQTFPNGFAESIECRATKTVEVPPGFGAERPEGTRTGIGAGVE